MSGVQVHWPRGRIDDYGGKVKVYRLTKHWRLSRAEENRLADFLILDMVRNHEMYDLGRAVLSATHWLKWLLDPDPTKIFCSALVALALMRLKRFPIGNPAHYPPSVLLKVVRRCGIYEPVAGCHHAAHFTYNPVGISVCCPCRAAGYQRYG